MAAAILSIATLLRFLRLDAIPLPLSDEVFAGVDVHWLVTTGHRPDGTTAGPLAYLVAAIDGRLLVTALHGASLLDLRIIAATFGVATVALLILLGRELGDLRLGLIGAAVLAVMPWHIYFSRIFYPASEYLFLTFLTLVLGLRALRTGSLAIAVASTAAAVAALYIYPVSIVATPLFVASVLFIRRQDLQKFGARKALLVLATALTLAIPYLEVHLAPPDPNVRLQNVVIANEMIWNHGLNTPTLAQGFLSRWLSFMTPSFTIFHGDPIVRWSIQSMGSLGWIIGPIGWIGVAVAVTRRSATDWLLLSWLALYPVADALTYYDAAPNGVRGIAGSVVWAMLAATALNALLGRAPSPRTQVALTTVALALVAVQLSAFAWTYFGAYSATYAYAFETGYPRIYQTLAQNDLDRVPITLHAGYRRDEMLQFFSGYHLHSSEQVLACYDLPYNVLHYTALPRIFVIREDPDEQTNPRCIHRGLIQRDLSALNSVVPQKGEQQRRVDVIAVFPDDVTGRFYTAVLLVHY